MSCTLLRFFTIYGPWGTQDMAPTIFADSIINKKPLKIFNHGNISRCFTFRYYVIESLIRLIYKPAKPNKLFNTDQPDSSTSWGPHRIYYIGSESSIKSIKFTQLLEDELGIKSIRE